MTDEQRDTLIDRFTVGTKLQRAMAVRMHHGYTKRGDPRRMPALAAARRRLRSGRPPEEFELGRRIPGQGRLIVDDIMEDRPLTEAQRSAISEWYKSAMPGRVAVAYHPKHGRQVARDALTTWRQIWRPGT